MKIENISIADIDGCEPDGWASPEVRMRVVAETKVSALSFEVWIPEEEGNDESALFVVSSAGNKTQFIDVTPSVPREVTIPVYLESTWDYSVKITCDHRVTTKGDDVRDLSFKMLGVKGVPV